MVCQFESAMEEKWLLIDEFVQLKITLDNLDEQDKALPKLKMKHVYAF